MKKTATILFLMTGMAISGGAQTMYDAFKFSSTNYAGTARTMAMGNAFTALGGDLGAVTLNPAGSAVSKYSQVTITPGINISFNTAVGTPVDGHAYGYERKMGNASAGFAIPNIGVGLSFDTHRNSGLKNWSFSFVGNATNYYNDDVYARGSNNATSLSSSLASQATFLGMNINNMLANNAYDFYGPANWAYVAAAQAGIIDVYQETPEGTFVADQFAGIAENAYLDNGQYRISLGGPIEQRYGRTVTGGKYDYVVNFGFNISDIFYFGANLGLSSLNYSSFEYQKESAQEDVFQTGFKDLRLQYNYDAKGTGVYGKFGFIVTPGLGLRFGASIQTPTSTRITENWSYAAESYSEYYTTNDKNEQMLKTSSYSGESPEGEYSYRLVSPMILDLGAAWTFGQIGLVSMDYEMTNYGSMRFREIHTNDQSGFDSVNTDIKENFGISHSMRMGLEIKPVPQFAIRAGYGFTTSPEKVLDGDGMVTTLSKAIGFGNSIRNDFAFGLGFSTKGSFFADFAVKASVYPKEYIIPYGDVIDEAGNVAILAPEISNSRTLLTMAVTLGFRF